MKLSRTARAPRAANPQRGVALIMVLLAMALVVTLVAGMMQIQSLRIYKTSHYLAQSEGKNIAIGAEAFAEQLLYKDYEDDQEDGVMIDSPDEVWAQYSAVIPYDETSVVEVQINDLSGRINLNNLVDASGNVNDLTRDRLTRLLQILDISNVRVEALIDWIDDNDQTVNAYGAEDGEYLGLDPPYRTGNQPFTSVSELRLITGMTEEAYRKLVPYVAALPVTGTTINVNMAPAPVLQSLHENLTAAQIETVIEQREDEPFETVQDFLALGAFAGLGLNSNGLGIRSEFFDIASRITVNDRLYRLVTTLYRDPQGAMYTIRRDESQTNLITKEPYQLSMDG
ncbi:type II secretion system minor pseudopilin GspK [Marinobacter sp. JSM 1782161]|uniref:type II secretion system minor pseudopilin GspK n=1 Tax=Marinobacter sp. JSM 1782161 TaxID=2685906 RepID=UPI001401E9A3|nr:type II secretion system minor pseudopilin GspK [Marinobacter sp. JSM 1782161]